MQFNPMLATDGYKVGHEAQYAKDTQLIFSNFTARSSARAVTLPKYIKDEVMLAGLSGFVQEVLVEDFNKNFFSKPLDEVLEKYQRRMDSYLGAGVVSTEHIAHLHVLGKLPIMIVGVPEGTLVPTKVPMLVMSSLDENFAWVTNYLETVLSSHIWQVCTNATTAFQYRCLLEDYAVKTGSPVDFVLWQGHDFSYRGMPGTEAAARSGAGHLYSFLGTDTLPALDYLDDYYSGTKTYTGGSVPASEHSVASTNILNLEEKYKDAANPKLEAEKEFFRRYFSEIYPSGVASYVSDTYDFWGVLTEVATANKDVILNRKPNALGLAKAVFRPDSGDPVDIICGRDFAELTETYTERDAYDDGINVLKYPDGTYWEVEHKAGGWYNDTFYIGAMKVKQLQYAEVVGAVETLWDIFGGTITDKGYKLLNERVGLIYGDSITLERAEEIMQCLAAKGFASGNIVLGIGSFTYQYNTRDTHGFAVKCTYAIIDDKEIQVYKDPKTDDGTKKSAKGLLNVFRNSEGKLEMHDQLDIEEWNKNVEKNGTAFVSYFYYGNAVEADIVDIRKIVNDQVIAKIG